MITKITEKKIWQEILMINHKTKKFAGCEIKAFYVLRLLL